MANARALQLVRFPRILLRDVERFVPGKRSDRVYGDCQLRTPLCTYSRRGHDWSKRLAVLAEALRGIHRIGGPGKEKMDGSRVEPSLPISQLTECEGRAFCVGRGV
jgi:hypothetical protein